MSAAAATQEITVTDTVPVIGDPVDRTINESALANGSAPLASGRNVAGSLQLSTGQDTGTFDGTPFATRLTTTTAPAGLTSDGADISYALSANGLTLQAYTGTNNTTANRVFTLILTNPTTSGAGYRFTLHKQIDHGAATSLDLNFGVTVTDSDNDTDSDGFTVTVTDDSPVATISRTINEDSQFTITTSADGTIANTVIWQNGSALSETVPGSGIYKLEHGTATVSATGTITYDPDPNYSGTEVFSYVTDDGGTPTTTTVTANVTPVSDAPTQVPDAVNINTLEDEAVSLGLNAPTITDDGTGTGNNAIGERIGAITLTGLPDGAQLLDGTGALVHAVSGTGPVTIVISDIPTVRGNTGTLTMTAAEYEALQILPPEHDSDNITVTATVSSFEVDANGDVISGVAGATATSAVVNVYVQAVTDEAILTFNGATAASVADVDTLTYGGIGGNTVANATIKEDTDFNLKSILAGTFADMDGSEVRSITIGNTTGQTIMVAGAALANGASRTISATGQEEDIDAFGNITIGGTPDFSGDLEGINITVNAQDVDADGYLAAGTPTANNVNGVAEANSTNNSVVLNLFVTPVAGDVEAGPAVSTEEDTAVAFLAGVRITDAPATGGTEVITGLSFTVPTGWVVADSTVSNGASWTATEVAGVYTIAFTAGSNAEREAVLDGFMITPAAHSSVDQTVSLDISTLDTQTVNGVVVPDTKTTTHTLEIEVTPVAEVISTDAGEADTDGNSTPDLTMTLGKTYSTIGFEDVWYDLDQDGFDFKAGWANEDTDEEVYARLTPILKAGDTTTTDTLGSQFSWTDASGPQTATYTGTPIDIPYSALHTVSFKPPSHSSGLFDIRVQAVTIDYDDDTEASGTPDIGVSGTATLANILAMPVADNVSLYVLARANGLEDTQIPLTIRPSSSDSSETFNVTISDIPPNAKITYGTQVFEPTNGILVIENFDPSTPLTILPPLNSNEDFDLSVTAVSVDSLEIDGVVFTSVSTAQTLPLTVQITGVADAATIVTVHPEYDESELDSGLKSIKLTDILTTAELFDDDLSERLTFRIRNLSEEFTIEGAVLVTTDATGTDRVWAVSPSQLPNVTITGPENYSGTETFRVRSVTTEDDGDSLTASSTNVSFTVRPSPEATMTSAAVFLEDEITTLGLNIVHENLDTDETLESVRILVSEADNSNFSLHLGTDPAALTLAEAVAAGVAGISVVTENGEVYYEFTPEVALTLAARSAAELDGILDGFQLFYKITDDSFGAASAGTSVTDADYRSLNFELTSIPVTDMPDLTITDIEGDPAVTTYAGTLNSIPTVTVTQTDTVTIDLNIASPDSDGSEKAIRVIIENVPLGVSVDGAEAIGPNSWLIVFDGVETLPINDAGGITLPVDFIVGTNAAGLSATGAPITMTVQVQDRGEVEEPEVETDVLEDTVAWRLTTTFTLDGPSGDPAVITEWEYTGNSLTEDAAPASMRLSHLINGTIAATSTTSNILTIQITDFPGGTRFPGMTRTVIGGVETWTASVTTPPFSTPQEVQQALDNLLNSIRIRLPEDANNNNNAPGFGLNATLTAAVIGGAEVTTASTVPMGGTAPIVPITPTTDEATIEIGLGASDVDGKLTERDNEIPLSITISNPSDGADGVVIDNTMYLQIGGDTVGLDGGTLTNSDGTVTYPLTTVTGVAGVPDGDYFIIPNASMGSTTDLIYTPPTMIAGNLTVDAVIVNQENGAADTLTGTQTEVLEIEISNNGVIGTTAVTNGSEAPDNSSGSIIELQGLSVSLEDNDGSERLISTLLSNLPVGFLVFAGADAGSAGTAAISSNAGGEDGTNTWILSTDGQPLPNFVGILPPANWSGTLSDLQLVVTSGENTLSAREADTIDLDDVIITPVANGVTVTDSSTFGNENQIIGFNLNVGMLDGGNASLPSASNPVYPDTSQETATIQVTGLGEHASIYVGTTLQTSNVTYDAGTDTYTISDLVQSDIDDLGFLQAANALSDQVAGSGLQLGLEIWTLDGTDESAHKTLYLTASVNAQANNNSDNNLLWTGQPINGRNGEDTINFRIGEDLTSADLIAQLTNVETLDLGIEGANDLTGFTPDALLAITDADNVLTINGTSDDTITLDGTWIEGGPGVYFGTIGAGGTEVTLTVTGGAVVTAPPGGFTTPPIIPFSSALLTADEEQQEFGLVFMDDNTGRANAGDDAPEAGLLLDDVLPNAPEEDLSALLPAEDAKPQDDPSFEPGGDGFHSYATGPIRTLWDDELEPDLV